MTSVNLAMAPDLSTPITTVGRLLAERGRVHPSRTMFRLEDDEITYGEMSDRAAVIARGLLVEGFTPGDRLALIAEHTLESWQLLMGCATAGVVPVLVNWRLAPSEIDFIADDANSFAVVATERFAEIEASLATGTDRRRAPLELWLTSLVESGSSAEGIELPEIAPEDDAVQLYTSGTTGLPKGVRTSHRAVLGLLAIMGNELAGFTTDSVHLVAAPLFHIAGYGYGLAGFSNGASSVLLPMFDPEEAGALIERHRCTNSLLVPAMLQAVVEAPGSAGRDFSSMRGILYGASPISVALLTKAVAMFQCRLTQAYGLTETTGVVTFLRWDDHEAGLAAIASGDPDTGRAAQRLKSAGYPYPGCQVRVVDESGEECREGEPGEVVAKTQIVMSGYWNRPEAEPVDTEGWFHCGDVGYFEEGYLYLVDRLNDKVVTKGENVFPGEIERILAEHPAVLECAVVGIPDDESGERLLAVVVLRDGEEFDLAALQAYCRPHIAGFKLPRELMVSVDPLPRTASGKILRRTIREPYWDGRDRQVN